MEFCHAWIKSKLGLRQFRVRGLVKVHMEMLWAGLTYNLQHWIRLRKLEAAASWKERKDNPTEMGQSDPQKHAR